MPHPNLAALLVVWQVFQPHLTRPAFARMIVMAVGGVLTTARKRAITEALVVTGVAGRCHHEAFHRFFSRGSWDPNRLGVSLLDKLQALGMPLRFALDDTLAGKKGPEVYGNCSHLDPVRPTKAFRVFTFGHCWVVLCLLVDLPFSQRPWALPVLFRLYRSVKHCQRKGIEHRQEDRTHRLAEASPAPNESPRACPSRAITMAGHTQIWAVQSAKPKSELLDAIVERHNRVGFVNLKLSDESTPPLTTG